MLVVEIPCRMPFAQQLRERGVRFGRSKFAQVDLAAGPGRPHRGQRWNEARIGEGGADRIGLPALRTARVKHQIVEIPEDEIAVAFIHPKAVSVFGVELEQDLAVQQQFEQTQRGGRGPQVELVDFPRLRQRGKGRGDGGVADPEQRACARQFQHHLVAAPAQIGKTRQHDGITAAELRTSRPVFGDLGLDDHGVLLIAPGAEAIFQKPLPGQPTYERVDFPGEHALA